MTKWAKWRYYDGEEYELSGCELVLNGFAVCVQPTKNGFMYWGSFGSIAYVIDIGYAKTRKRAQRDVLDKLSELLDNWKMQTTRALAELEAVTEP